MLAALNDGDSTYVNKPFDAVTHHRAIYLEHLLEDKLHKPVSTASLAIGGQMASDVYLTFFGSFVFGTPGFPLSDVPLQQIAGDAAAGRLDVEPVRVFRFEDIQEAHRVMEANQAGGKMVVVHD